MRKKYEHSSGVSEEAAFELGVVYSAVKDELVAFAAKEGNPYSFADVAARVAKLLQAEAVREQLRRPEYLSQMRQNGTRHHPGRPPKSGYDELGSTSEIFTGSSASRSLSKKARKAISKAQRERWARYHEDKAAERERWRESSKARRERAGAKQKPITYRKNRASGMKGYWASMSEEERSREMTRRHKVAAEKRKASAA